MTMDFTLPYGHFFLDAYSTYVLTVLWTVVLSVPNSTDSTSGHFFMTCTVYGVYVNRGPGWGGGGWEGEI